MRQSLLLLACVLAFSAFAQAQGLVEVSIVSSLDQTEQPALSYAPKSDTSVPLLVLLHTWSGNYKQKGHIEVALKECQERGWALIHPNFRGPNWTPDACGSSLAVQDIIDAVNWMKQHHKIDDKRIYLTGVSGGGHMSMLMAGKHPEIWAGVSAWVGISDLSAWHIETKKAGRNYSQHIEKAVGGVPGVSAAIDEQLRQRSPLTFLGKAKGLPIDLNAGIHDGHTGSVPISHTLRAFNLLAETNGQPKKALSEQDIQSMTKTQIVPNDLKFVSQAEKRQHAVLFRRQAGPVRVIIFEGGHEGDLPTAIRWLARQSR